MAYWANFKNLLKTLRTGAGFGDYDAGISVDFPNVETIIGNGTASSQFDRWFYDSRSLGAGANEDLDLQTLLDAAGVALGSAEARFLRIESDAANTNRIQYKAGAANGWAGAAAPTQDPTDIINIPPGCAVQFELFVNGSNTIDATHKVINILSVTTAGTYRIGFLGCSA
jgi:hypothetical protein